MLDLECGKYEKSKKPSPDIAKNAMSEIDLFLYIIVFAASMENYQYMVARERLYHHMLGPGKTPPVLHSEGLADFCRAESGGDKSFGLQFRFCVLLLTAPGGAFGCRHAVTGVFAYETV